MTQEEIYAENERIMAQYRPYITKKVLDRYGTSFQNAENLGDSWRDNILYSPAVEEFLVLETRVFIRLYTNTDNLRAIRALVKMISGYLAVFVQMAPDTGSLNRARKKLKHLLFDESDFVQHIINQKKAEHDAARAKYEAAVARKQANREYTQRKQAEAAARKAKLAEIQSRKRPRVYIKKSDAENKINTFIAQAKSNVR